MKMIHAVLVSMVLVRSSDVHCDRVFSITDQVSSCSSQLASIIFNFCNKTYKIVKRDTSLLLEKLAPKNLQKEQTRRRLLAEGRWRRFRRDVATECCQHSCTVGDLISYCSDESKLLRENPDIFE